MIAPWLIYACAIGIVIVAIALLLEVMARLLGRSARWIWFAAIMAIVAVPVLLNFAVRATPQRTRSVSARWIASRSVSSVATQARRVSLDAPLLAIWAAASLLMFARVMTSAVRIGRRRRNWEAIELDGRQVLLTEDLGPAVVGWGRLDTVVPRWALALDQSSRDMMLAHEGEHARSGDPYLRTAAIAALVAMPWNPAIWYAMRRLRLAVEIDCDQRLLARGIDAHRYASFLLAVGERMAAPPFAWVTALAGPRSSLESRILAMTSPFRPRNPRLIATALTAGIAVLVVVACEGPVPASVLPPAASSTSTAGGVSALSLIKSTTFVTTCAPPSASEPNSNCRLKGSVSAVIRASDELPLARLSALSDLDQVRIDTVYKQCGPQYVCQAKVERIDTMVVLRPIDVEGWEELPTRDGKFDVEGFRVPVRDSGAARPVEMKVGWDCSDASPDCDANFPEHRAEMVEFQNSRRPLTREVGITCLAEPAPLPQTLDQWLARRKSTYWSRGC